MDRRILSLRYRGYDEEDIASLLDVSLSRVRSAILRVAKASVDEERANIVREAEIVKLELMEAAVFAAAVHEPDDDGGISKSVLSAQNQVLKIMERRTQLLGIDRQPPQVGNVGIGLTLVQILATMPNVIEGTVNEES